MEAPVLPANREATPPTALVPAAASSSNALPAALRPPAPQIRRSASQHRPPLRSLLANAVVRAGDSPRLQPWRTRSLTPDQRRPVSTPAAFGGSSRRLSGCPLAVKRSALGPAGRPSGACGAGHPLGGG